MITIIDKQRVDNDECAFHWLLSLINFIMYNYLVQLSSFSNNALYIRRLSDNFQLSYLLDTGCKFITHLLKMQYTLRQHQMHNT